MTRGAIMAFESVHGLATDGIAGPQVWSDLLSDVQDGQSDPDGYAWVSVSETLPETLVLWQNGTDVLTTRVNTGVRGATTPQGTWPVYARYRSETMTGTNPNGTHYSDPGVPDINYFLGGDAVHGFVRGSYGYPQSNGCVEVPLTQAADIFPLLYIGALVTVS
jgi:peptidoglycan hydrolase-like protein with peptidoglycan-binding domain